MVIAAKPSSVLVMPEAVVVLLRDLLGKPVNVVKGTPWPVKAPVTVATYGDGGKPVAIIVCDMPLAASAGAALALIPAAVALESVKAGKLGESIAENLHEVFNIGVRLFPVQPGTRLHLADVFMPPTAAPAEVMTALAKPAGRADFAVTIPGYPPGKLSLFLL